MTAVKQRVNVSILDTSLLFHEPESMFAFGDNIIDIPFPVLQEIDHHKSKKDGGTWQYAQQVSRLLDQLGSERLLNYGVPLKNGGHLIVDSDPYVPKGLGYALKIDSTDNFIIGVALKWQHWKETRHRNKTMRAPIARFFDRFDIDEVRIISKDINLRVKAGACGIRAEDWERGRAIENISDLYTGLATIDVEEEGLAYLNRLFHEECPGKQVPRDRVEEFAKLPDLAPNAGCIFRNGKEKVTLAIYKQLGDKRYFQFVERPGKDNQSRQRIRPRNYEQALAYALLKDPRVRILTLSGIAGGGKTLLALLAGTELTDNPQRYDKVIVYRANSEMGKEIGFLKGSIDQKTAPWAQPIYDNLELIANGGEREVFESKSKHPPVSVENLRRRVEVSLINFLRGSSIHNKFVIVDETQNFKPGDMKKVLQRMATGTKFVLTGDVDQIDNPYLDPRSNGLSHVIQGLKGMEEVGHITFTTSEREPLVEQVTRRL